MKKMREINYIFYMTLLYMLSSLYTLLNKGEVYKLFNIEKLMKYKILIIIVAVLGTIFLLVNYYRNTKQAIETLIFKIILPIGVILLGLNYPNFGFGGIMHIMVVYLIVSYIFMYPVIFCKNRKNADDNNLKLYPSRKNLMDVLSHALEEYSLIALDGTWGSGKTTFMNIAMRENKEKYYYIPINVMLFENRNSLKTEFLNQLKGIFKEEGIFQGLLMDFDYYLDGVSNDWVKVVKNIIFSKSKSFKEANEKLKSEIGKIEKRIVVGVDNLERIYGESEPEWKQILGFIYELQELGIKIVVMANLEEMLIPKKDTKEKDLSNHEYFDKFYEFKLKLNEVTTEEIIDGIRIKGNTLDKEWLKDQVAELTKKISQRREGLDRNKQENEKKIEEYEGLQWRYLNEIKNPRKIEKLIKNIQTKQEKIENIFNFIGEEDYRKLIFRVSLYEVIFFEYVMEYKRKVKIKTQLKKEMKIDQFIEHPFSKNEFLQEFGYNEFGDVRAINRILYYDSEENLVKDDIEKLTSIEKISLSEMNKVLNNLEIYSSSLDPDYDQKTTKKAYKIIESKLIDLEKMNKERIHKIIKENEENICRLNYLTYPDNLGIFESIKYKFNNENIYMMYRELEDILRPRRSRSHNELGDMLKTIIVYYYFEKENFIEMQEIYRNVNLDEINEMIDKIKPKEEMLKRRKEENISSIEKAENIIYDMVLNFLMIIKINMEKKEVTIIDEVKLENWEEYDLKQKEELLNIVENDFENIKEKFRESLNSNLFVAIKKKSDLLKNIIEKEEDQRLILKLDDLIRVIEYKLIPFEIFKKVNDINIKVDSNEKISLRAKLLNFIKIRSKEKRYQHIFNWSEIIEKLGEIGIILEEGKWIIKFQGEMVEEEREEEPSL